MPLLDALLGLNAIAQVEFLLGLAVSGIVMIGAAAVADRLLRRGRPRLRAACWMIALAILGVLPFWRPAFGTLVVQPPALLASADNAAPVGPARQRVAESLARSGLVDPAHFTTEAGSPGPGPVAWCLAAWLLVAGIRWTRLGLAARHVRRALRGAALPDERIARLAMRLCDATGVHPAVRVGAFEVPFSFGWRNPVISLPHAALSWDDELLASVLAHEFAHVQRGDWIRQILATLVCDLYWFLPGARLPVQRLMLAAELRCDELVIGRGIEARAYAAHLLAVAGGSGHTLVPAACFAQPLELETRIRALVTSRPARSRGILLIIGVMFVGATTLVAAVRPSFGACDATLPVRLELPAR